MTWGEALRSCIPPQGGGLAAGWGRSVLLLLCVDLLAREKVLPFTSGVTSAAIGKNLFRCTLIKRIKVPSAHLTVDISRIVDNNK